jgi:hypothetical protein
MAINGLFLHTGFPMLLQYFPFSNDDFKQILRNYEGEIREGFSHPMQLDEQSPECFGNIKNVLNISYSCCGINIAWISSMRIFLYSSNTPILTFLYRIKYVLYLEVITTSLYTLGYKIEHHLQSIFVI